MKDEDLSPVICHPSLNNYHRLIERVDRHCQGIQNQYGELMDCRKGCSACCRHISVFPVEAVAMMDSIAKLPKAILACLDKYDGIRLTECPLLKDAECLIYPARPLICRTHGFPLLTVESDMPVISCCPQNFQNLSPIPSQAVIDLEPLNRMLVAINALFLKEWDKNPWPTPRVRLSDVIQACRIDLTIM
ncbi:MAG: YkgJ family cysteine cluster protein [Desulfatirhabdiaceae bacterium]